MEEDALSIESKDQAINNFLGIGKQEIVFSLIVVAILEKQSSWWPKGWPLGHIHRHNERVESSI